MINLNTLRNDISNSKTRLHNNYVNVVNKCYRLLNENNLIISEIENEWLKHFKLVYGEIEENLSSNKKINSSKLKDYYRLDCDEVKEYRVFFAIQTYYALLIKLIASRFVGSLKKYEDVSKNKSLIEKITYIVQGDFFNDLNICNYCYEDWFNWFLYVNDDEMMYLLSELTECIDEYKDDNIINENFQNNDYIKQIYEAVIPRELRHGLGEYYTPDWLAEYTIKNVYKMREMQGLKMLDPTCGSGTFIFKTIRFLRENNINLDVEDIIKNVKGFDINPLAVLTAKTNYLISIFDMIDDSIKIEIPIYSYDIINIPKIRDKYIEIDIDNNIYKIPETIFYNIDVKLFQDILKETISQRFELDKFINRILNVCNLSDKECSALKDLYNEIFRYGNTNISMIWVNLVINYIKAFKEKEFDVIIGNPPWINWEYIPQEYRVKSQYLWGELGIFSAKGRELAFSKEDVSTLITYLVIDRLLKDKGYLAFVIRQGIFKSAQNGIGFRKFKIRNEIDIKVCKIDDLVSVKPFENATNQTAVMYLQKGVENTYPVDYIEWKKKTKGTLKSYESLEKILTLIDKVKLVAKPSVDDDITSLWITVNNNLIHEFDKILGKNNYKARTGIFTGGANAVYWMNINKTISKELVEISNITARAKRKAENVSVNIESKYIYPLLKGSDVNVWEANPSIYMLCPHTRESKMKPVPLIKLKEEVPLTVDYLEYFKTELDERKGFAGWEKENQKENFHSVLRVGEYTFSKYKVIWRYIASEFITAVISDTDDSYLGKKMILPNEKIMYVSTDNETEAYYLCGVLSSTPISLCVKSFMNPTSISTHVLEKLNIADFDENNELHVKIANICKRGHLTLSKREKKELLNEIDRIIAKIYDISSSGLQYILKETT